MVRFIKFKFCVSINTKEILAMKYIEKLPSFSLFLTFVMFIPFSSSFPSEAFLKSSLKVIEYMYLLSNLQSGNLVSNWDVSLMEFLLFAAILLERSSFSLLDLLTDPLFCHWEIDRISWLFSLDIWDCLNSSKSVNLKTRIFV